MYIYFFSSLLSELLSSHKWHKNGATQSQRKPLKPIRPHPELPGLSLRLVDPAHRTGPGPGASCCPRRWNRCAPGTSSGQGSSLCNHQQQHLTKDVTNQEAVLDVGHFHVYGDNLSHWAFAGRYTSHPKPPIPWPPCFAHQALVHI